MKTCVRNQYRESIPNGITNAVGVANKTSFKLGLKKLSSPVAKKPRPNHAID
ncbi:MAG TPA: hypothetical protein VF207_07425 [Chthoniobacterales bacterium]